MKARQRQDLIGIGLRRARLRPIGLLSAVLCALALPAVTSAGTAGIEDRGLYVAYCPEGEEAPGRVEEAPNQVEEPPSQVEEPASIASSGRRAVVAEANHGGWPADECLKMDKGPVGKSHVIIGIKHVHNWLLGGYGNDTIFAGDDGDVVWGDYHPGGQSESQRDYIHGGAGEDWIYSSHGYNEIWTGAGNDHLALVYGHGVVFCDGPGLKTFVMRYLPQNRRWRLVGCSHKTLVLQGLTGTGCMDDQPRGRPGVELVGVDQDVVVRRQLVLDAVEALDVIARAPSELLDGSPACSSSIPRAPASRRPRVGGGAVSSTRRTSSRRASASDAACETIKTCPARRSAR